MLLILTAYFLLSMQLMAVYSFRNDCWDDWKICITPSAQSSHVHAVGRREEEKQLSCC